MENNSQSTASQFIDDIKRCLTQIEQRVNQQTTIFDEMTEQNSSIIQQLDILSANIDNLINEHQTTPNNNNPEQYEQNFGTFNMETKIINFNSKTYNYTKEQLCSDIQSLQIAYDQFNTHKKTYNFPQGESYIISLFETKIQSKETIIILSNQTSKRTTFFYFPLNNYKDLCYSKGYRVLNKKKEFDKLDKYTTDNYPQGRDYCIKLIKEPLNKNECFHILAREDGDKWTRYYFKSKYIEVYPSEIQLLNEKNQLENELNQIKKMKNKELFPQGIKYCIEIIHNQIEKNGEVFVVKEENDMISYFLPEEVKYFCNCEWRVKTYEHELQNIEKISISTTDDVTQGSEYCVKLVKDSEKKNEAFRVYIKNTDIAFFFYFNDEYD